jgi:hypothetical protein
VFLSLGSLHTLVVSSNVDEEDEEELENEEVEESFLEIGDTLGINARKLNYGFIISMDLMIIVYFVFTFFILNVLFLKALAIILIANWVYDIIGVIDNMINTGDTGTVDEEDEFTWKDRLYELYLWLHNIATIGFIAVTFFVIYLT